MYICLVRESTNDFTRDLSKNTKYSLCVHQNDLFWLSQCFVGHDRCNVEFIVRTSMTFIKELLW